MSKPPEFLPVIAVLTVKCDVLVPEFPNHSSDCCMSCFPGYSSTVILEIKAKHCHIFQTHVFIVLCDLFTRTFMVAGVGEVVI